MRKQKKDKIRSQGEITHLLECTLTQDDVLAAAQELATALDELRTLANEKDSVLKTLKAKETELKARVAIKQLLVRNKTEWRDVKCEVFLDFDTNKYYEVRQDNKQKINVRPMTEDEKQLRIDWK